MTSSTPNKHEPPTAKHQMTSAVWQEVIMTCRGKERCGGREKKPARAQPTVGRPVGEVFCIIALTAGNPSTTRKPSTGDGTQTAATFFPSWNTSEDRVSMEVLRNSGVLSSVRTIGWMMRDA